MNPRTNELAVLAAHCSPMQAHSPAQAAPLLGMDLSDIQSAAPGDPDFVPYLPDPDMPRNRLFLLGDLLVAAEMADAIPNNGDPVKREDAEATLQRRVGPPPPVWFEPGCYDSRNTAQRAILGPALGGLQGATAMAPPKKGRGRPRKVESLPGGRIILATRFVSTSDFFRRARLDDSWVFAKPSGQRPYDFIESAIAMDSAPWKVMTLSDYLDAVRSGAAEDEAGDRALNEGDEIARYIDS